MTAWCAAILSALSFQDPGPQAEVSFPRSWFVRVVSENPVVDGDGILLVRDPITGLPGPEEVRMLGINAPEFCREDPQASQPWGDRARAGLATRVQVGGLVEFRSGCPPRLGGLYDYGSYRPLAHLFVHREGSEPLHLNRWMVREGLAIVTTVPPNTEFQEALIQAQREAMRDGAGLWGRVPDAATLAGLEGWVWIPGGKPEGNEKFHPSENCGDRRAPVYYRISLLEATVRRRERLASLGLLDESFEGCHIATWSVLEPCENYPDR